MEISKKENEPTNVLPIAVKLPIPVQHRPLKDPEKPQNSHPRGGIGWQDVPYATIRPGEGGEIGGRRMQNREAVGLVHPDDPNRAG